MPTLEVQLAKAEKDLVAIEKLTGIYPSTWEWGWGSRPNRADTLHGNMAERRGLIQRIRYLQQRLERRNNRPQQVLIPTESEAQNTEQK